ncbi:MAG: cadmium resistance transporter [Cyanobacteriota bacterium]
MEATTAFSATNVDDLFLLMLFFSRLDHTFRIWQVVAGQFLGIASLLAVSLLAVAGRLALPEGLIGLLGLFPISLGLSQLADALVSPAQQASEPDTPSGGPWLAGLLGVAGLTIANGSDNISVYMALLANSDPLRLRIFPLVFAALTALWCLMAWRLSQSGVLGQLLRRLQRELAPVLLVGIGMLVLLESEIPRHPPLAAVALICLGVMVGSLLLQLRPLLPGHRLAPQPQPGVPPP